MEETLEYFSPDGRPLRAVLAITLTQQKITTFAIPELNAPTFTRRGRSPAGTQPQIPQVVTKTGTVAGTITLTLSFTTASGADVTPPGLTPQRIQVGRAAPGISLVTCTRNAGGFTVVIDGFTNTREAIQATFDFNAASGASLGTTQLVVTTASLLTSASVITTARSVN